MSTRRKSTESILQLICAALCLLSLSGKGEALAQQPAPSPAQTPQPTAAQIPSTSARPILKTIKLNVQYGGRVPAARKHFYLSRLPFNLEEMQQKLGNLPSHQDYLRKVSGHGLSEEMVSEFIREWLERYRCETVYCQPITSEDKDRIRLFKAAYEKSSAVFKNAREQDGSEMALSRLPNFLPREIATGYFDMKMDWVKRAIALMEAETVGGEKNLVRSVMTDRKGEAYITEVRPGATYYLSNLVPIEDGKDCFLWNTKKEVKEGPGLEVGVTLGPNTRVKELKGAGGATLAFTCAPSK